MFLVAGSCGRGGSLGGLGVLRHLGGMVCGHFPLTAGILCAGLVWGACAAPVGQARGVGIRGKGEEAGMLLERSRSSLRRGLGDGERASSLGASAPTSWGISGRACVSMASPGVLRCPCRLRGGGQGQRDPTCPPVCSFKGHRGMQVVGSLAPEVRLRGGKGLGDEPMSSDGSTGGERGGSGVMGDETSSREALEQEEGEGEEGEEEEKETRREERGARPSRRSKTRAMEEMEFDQFAKMEADEARESEDEDFREERESDESDDEREVDDVDDDEERLPTELELREAERAQEERKRRMESILEKYEPSSGEAEGDGSSEDGEAGEEGRVLSSKPPMSDEGVGVRPGQDFAGSTPEADPHISRTKPRSLHGKISGSIAVAAEAKLMPYDSPLINMALDLRTKIVVSRESRTTVPSAVVSSHDGQTVVVRPGTFGWKGRLVVRRSELHGERVVRVCGEKGNDYVVLAGGKRVLMASQMVGRWDCRPLAAGMMREITVFYNATADLIAAADALDCGEDEEDSEEGGRMGDVGSEEEEEEEEEDAICSVDMHRYSTMFMDNVTWQFEACQIRSVSGIALSVTGASTVAMQDCRAGGMGIKILVAEHAAFVHGESQVVMSGTTLEHAGLSALHVDWDADVELDSCVLTRARVGVSLARAGSAMMQQCRADDLSTSFCYVCEGLLGQDAGGEVYNATALGLYDCDVSATLFQGYARPGDFAMEGTRHEGAEDGEEKDRVEYADLARRSIDAAMSRGESTAGMEDPEEVTKERYKEIGQEAMVELIQDVATYMRLEPSEKLELLGGED